MVVLSWVDLEIEVDLDTLVREGSSSQADRFNENTFNDFNLCSVQSWTASWVLIHKPNVPGINTVACLSSNHRLLPRQCPC